MRTVTSFQFGRLSTPANERAGTKRPAGAVWAGIDELK